MVEMYLHVHLQLDIFMEKKTFAESSFVKILISTTSDKMYKNHLEYMSAFNVSVDAELCYKPFWDQGLIMPSQVPQKMR